MKRVGEGAVGGKVDSIGPEIPALPSCWAHHRHSPQQLLAAGSAVRLKPRAAKSNDTSTSVLAIDLLYILGR